MGSYRVVIEARAERELRKLSTGARKKVSDAINNLGINSLPRSSRKMVGSAGYRLRVGNYRVIYEVEHKIVSVFIIKIGYRRDIYKS